jgi:hypothetical protein
MWRGSDSDSFWLQDLEAVGYILRALFAYVQCIAWRLGSSSDRERERGDPFPCVLHSLQMYYYNTILHAITTRSPISISIHVNIQAHPCLMIAMYSICPNPGEKNAIYKRPSPSPSPYHTELLSRLNILSPICSPSPPLISSSSSSQIKPKPLHTSPVLGHHVRARGLRVLGRGEQHALVAGGFLFFAHAAGLDFGRALGAGGFV